MKPETAKALKTFKQVTTQLSSLEYASSIIFWDASTGAPKSGVEARSRAIGVISGFFHQTMTDDTFKSALERLSEELDTLEEVDRALVKHYVKDFEKLSKIPAQEYEDFQAHLAKSASVWEEAKDEANFEAFKPYLETTIETLKKFADYRGYTGHPYNIYIDDYEPGMTVDQLDTFFDTLKERLVPLLHKINDKPKKIGKLKGQFPLEVQEKTCEMLLDLIGFRRSEGLFKESVHPFTMGVDMKDVRLTTHYYVNDLLSAMFSTVHEGGHGIYEQNVSEKLRGTPLSTGASNAFHESQSRIYENNFFRNQSFIHYVFPLLKKAYPIALEEVDEDQFYKVVNKVEPSLIRVEADELTYSLHILLRYELELALISGTLSVADLPKAWYDKMEQYLGVVPTNDAEGVLQDVHWSEALFGYFPTYALGSAYAAQLFYYMKKELDIDALLSKGDFKPITAWLNDKVHQYGALYEPTELIVKITGEPLNATYYCDYLEEKYATLYSV